jgi:dienelactone hydrolase
MATARIHLAPKQRQRLARRAKKQGRSLSHEVSKAVDFCLSVPPETQKELSIAAKAANQATDRMINNLDQTIAHIDRVLKERRKANK